MGLAQEVGVATEELVDRARAGDSASYDRLFDRVARRLLLYVRLRLGKGLRKVLDPLDVMQETYLEAHRSFAHFQPRGEGAFLRWLCRIAENRMNNLADHHGAQKRRPVGGLVPISGALERIRTEEMGPSSAVARSEKNEQLLRCIQELREEERQVLLLRYFEGRTLAEIGRATGRSLSAARRLLLKAEVRLGAILRRSEVAE